MPHFAHIEPIVRDYDEALAVYVGKLGFTLVEGYCNVGFRLLHTGG